MGTPNHTASIVAQMAQLNATKKTVADKVRESHMVALRIASDVRDELVTLTPKGAELVKKAELDIRLASEILVDQPDITPSALYPAIVAKLYELYTNLAATAQTPADAPKPSAPLKK